MDFVYDKKFTFGGVGRTLVSQAEPWPSEFIRIPITQNSVCIRFCQFIGNGKEKFIHLVGLDDL